MPAGPADCSGCGPGGAIFGDTAYSTGDVRRALTAAGHRLFIKPAPLRPAVHGGFTMDGFASDTTTGTGELPRRTQRPLTDPGVRHHQCKAMFGNLCTRLTLRERCTRAKAGRILTIRPHRWRPPVERAVARLVHRGYLRLSHSGTVAGDARLHARVAALNNDTWHLSPATP